MPYTVSPHMVVTFPKVDVILPRSFQLPTLAQSFELHLELEKKGIKKKKSERIERSKYKRVGRVIRY